MTPTDATGRTYDGHGEGICVPNAPGIVPVSPEKSHYANRFTSHTPTPAGAA